MSKITATLEMMRTAINNARLNKGLSYVELSMLASVAVEEVKLLDSNIADMGSIALFRLADALDVNFMFQKSD